MAPVPVDFRHQQQVGILEIAPQLAAVGGLAHQVEFVLQVLLEFRHHLARAQALAVLPQGFDQAGTGIEQRDIVGDDVGDVGAQDFHCRLAAILQPGEVDLGDGSGSHRHRVEFGEHLTGGLAVSFFYRRQGDFRRERRHPVLQSGEFVGDIGGNQVAPGGEHLAEFDEDRPERFERLAQPDRARLVERAPEQRDHDQRPQPAKALMAEDEFFQAEAQGDIDDFGEAQEFHCLV